MQRIYPKLVSTGLSLALSFGSLVTLSSAARAADDNAPRTQSGQVLSHDSTMAVQRALSDHHVYQGKIDGVWGPKTQDAVRKFQSQNQLQATGTVDDATLEKLGLRVEQVNGQDTPQVVQAVGHDASDDAKTGVQLSALNADQAKEMQQRLQLLGYFKGPIDGHLGDSTRSALHAFFQHQADLASKGVVSNAAIGLFGTQPNDVQHVNGTDQKR